ncbi:protein GRAVITROPIC IN THE LIGHT 1-like [Nymphaea colorata]|uniref:Uncharacterized protein n=1 Tax=Nymphaea colorata TaxID=210225 RepID=A0A5K1CRT4_9MAGN|nr:protein GRAVITROPIC IN THE LIGHT 1-like [Nymphaea colorata]
MQEMEKEEGTVKPPQITELFQRLASVCKSKTIEFFAEEDEYEQIPAMGDDDFDSKEELITDQKVVVIKPDHLRDPSEMPQIGTSPNLDSFLSCIFANIAAFESAYLQLQTAHTPFDVENVKAADRSAIAQLRKLSEVKHSYRTCSELPSLNWLLEAQVEERQSMLRTYEMTVNRLQSEIDRMDSEASVLKAHKEKLIRRNSVLTKRLEELNFRRASLSLSVFDSALREAIRLSHSFTKVLIDYMKHKRWDLDSAADSLHPGIDYAKKGHNRYAFLSYVCLEMFRGFDDESFSELNVSSFEEKDHLKRFISCSSIDALEVLRREEEGGFSKFCRKKYLQLVHPKMELSFLGNTEQRDVIANYSCSSWPLTNPLLVSFVKMAHAIWLLHILASAFESALGIFQVKRGARFSMVFMENVVRKSVVADSGDAGSAPIVGFTVVPGFRIGKTVIQCQVYLDGMRCIE